MEFADASFDLVFESTMFILTDEAKATSIAQDMIRVTRDSGFIVLADWRYGKPRNPDFRGVSRERISRLLDVGTKTRILRSERGALIPPVGRFLSRVLPSFYFPVQALFPFLAGQTTTVLQTIPVG